jgi:hypothetical protein
MSRTIIIYQPWGGLGDNLQFSTLPKLYSELGYDVYISASNVYRNPEIYDLVWKNNPYIKGISELPPNAGSCKGCQHMDQPYIKNIELSHGITHGTDRYPTIYYTPKKIEALCNTVVYDITSSTSIYSDDFIKTKFTSQLEQYPECEKRKIQFEQIKNRMTPDLHHDVIEINSIFDLCDVIFSCKAFICTFSGSVVLASAVKNSQSSPYIHCFHNKQESLYIFDNVQYSFT